MDLVRTALVRDVPNADLEEAGLRVFTTLVPRTQDAVERAMGNVLTQTERERSLAEGELQAAVLIASSQTGEVEAVAGGRNAGESGFNRALNAARPVGSLIKPVVFLSALETGYHLASPIDDAPVSVPLEGQKPWEPENFHAQTHGSVPLVRALGDSLNLATVNLGLAVGVDGIADRLESLTERPTGNRYPSLLLGAETLTPLEVLGLYATFASGGFHTPAKSVIAVVDAAGTPVAKRRFELDSRIAATQSAALTEALKIVMRSGTGSVSAFARAGVAGKTGTSDDYRDSWFAGFDHDRVAVVWVGYDDNRPTGLTGATGALRVFDDIFSTLGVAPLPDVDASWAEIEYASGLLASAQCADVVRVPIPADAGVQHKPGCGGALKRFANGFRESLRTWLD